MRTLFTSSGRVFAQVVYVRLNEQCFGVLMPGFENPDAAETYHGFLKNENEELRVSNAWLNLEKDVWEVYPQPMVTHWPKKDESFQFD